MSKDMERYTIVGDVFGADGYVKHEYSSDSEFVALADVLQMESDNIILGRRDKRAVAKAKKYREALRLLLYGCDGDEMQCRKDLDRCNKCKQQAIDLLDE